MNNLIKPLPGSLTANTISGGPRRRIVHIIHLDGPGGGPRTTLQHVSYYSQFFDVTVIHGGHGHLTDFCRKLGIKEIRLPLERLSSSLNGSLHLWFALRRIRPDLLILHGQWAAPLGVLVGRLAGIKRSIYICHWPSFYTDWDLIRIIRNYILEWIPCRLATKVITISQSNYARYLQRTLVSPDRLAMIPNPVPLLNVPTAGTAEEVRKTFGWHDDLRHVVSVGRLSDQKRVDWLLHAWALTTKHAPEARLWIVGDGPQAPMLAKLAQELEIEASCKFLGSQAHGWNFVAAADIVVMTSVYEARGNVVTEAMSCGKPIVASNVDGITDTLNDAIEGYLVPPGNPEILAQRLVELIRDPEKCVLMGKNGQTSVQHLDQKTILPKYLTIIREVLKTSPPHIMKLTKSPKLYAWAFAAISLLCIAAVDSCKTHEFSLLAFYFIPVGLVSWFGGKKDVFLISTIAATIWIACNLMSHHPNTVEIAIWNGFMRWVCFVVFGLSYSSLRTALRNREAIIEELQRSLEQVKTLSGYVPICPSCHDIRVDSGKWEDLHSFVKEQSNIEFVSALCPKCGKAEIHSETHNH